MSFSVGFVVCLWGAAAPHKPHQSGGLTDTHVCACAYMEIDTWSKQTKPKPTNPNQTKIGGQVYVAADLGKIVSDEIYGPMFFQVSGQWVVGVGWGTHTRACDGGRQ